MLPTTQQGKLRADVVVYVPGLTGPFNQSWQQHIQSIIKQELAACDSLSSILSRSSCMSTATDSFYHQAYNLLTGSEFSDKLDAPMAAYRYNNSQLNNIETEGSWFINCDPVLIRPDRDQAVLLLPDADELSERLSEQIIVLINNHFAEEPWQLTYVSPERWVIASAQKFNLTTTSLFDAQGQNIDPLLPVGDDAKYWTNVLNEMQMLIHQYNSKLQFENASLGFNSVWLWGAGCKKPGQTTTWLKMSTDVPELVPLMSSDNQTATQLSEFSAEKNTLVVVGGLLHALRNRDFVQWATQLKKLESTVFEKLVTALKNKTVMSVKIMTDLSVYTVTAKDLSKWWRRKHSLYSFMQWNKNA